MNEAPRMESLQAPAPGALYDLTFPARPDLGTVRVKVLAGDQRPHSTPCGAECVYIEVISGRIPKANPDDSVNWIEPGQTTTIPIFIPRWTRVQ